ncbi:MAG TPA: glutathione S-transferase family protein [Myxococcota bacterium]|nr:glutathione S-transferase family protein [Myxococcota bacterium]
MALELLMHPLSSFCHKVLIALYENGTTFEPRVLDLSDPAQRGELRGAWGVGKIPVLRDTGRGVAVPETSIIIEYLDRHYPGPVPLVPTDSERAREARLWDRFFDLYVHVPMQKIVGDLLRPKGSEDAYGVAEARATLRTAYEMAERQLAGKTWAIGSEFTLADCAAAPALFYGGIAEPFAPGHPALNGYFERLVARPSFARTLREARPYFVHFPLKDRLPARFL